MTIYEDLRALHNNWRKERWAFYTKVVQFTWIFCREFGRHIGAPDGPLPTIGDEASNQSYLSLVKVDPLDDNDEYRLHDLEPGEIYDQHLSEDKNDGLVFGLKVYVETAPNQWPKQPFWFRFSLKPTLGKCELRVFRKSFWINLDDQATFVPVYDHLVDQIKQVLTEQPGERFSNRSSIGFLAPLTSPGE